MWWLHGRQDLTTDSAGIPISAWLFPPLPKDIDPTDLPSRNISDRADSIRIQLDCATGEEVRRQCFPEKASGVRCSQELLR